MLVGKKTLRKHFYFKKYHFDEGSGELALTYGVGTAYEFTEKITFPPPFVPLTPAKKQVLNHIFFLTHIAFGISYYKAFLPEKIVVESGTLTKGEAAFFDKLYTNGLGEFAVKNNVKVRVKFPFDKAKKTRVASIPFAKRFLVPVGGGKDSSVVLELLQRTKVERTAVFAGNPPKPVLDAIQAAGISGIFMKRALAPMLLELNKAGKTYNGHVPVSGLFAFLLWVCSVLYDYGFVAMANERSANEGNVEWDGMIANHQYSKSFEFERDFKAIVDSLTPNFRYFSILRPLSEIHIAKLFAKNCKAYFDIFTSCNKAFKWIESNRIDRWCGNCDKCRFVFLILAPFMNKKRLIKAVGKNPLDDENQIEGYKELLGLSGHKPFECVGEARESRWSFARLAKDPAWQGDAIVRALAGRVGTVSNDDLFVPSMEHLIPEEFKNVIFFKL